VGEAQSAARLTTRIKERFPDRKILLSTFTITGREIARQRVANVDGVIFFPFDHPWFVRRALSFFDPCLLVFLETEIWPNVLRSAYLRGIPTLLLSGRLSRHAFRRYRLFRRFFHAVIRQFTALGIQNEENAERFILLGASPEKVSITGNLKLGPLQQGDRSERAGKTALGLTGKEHRQILVAGSTHHGEEEVLLDVFLFLKPRFPDLLMVLAPRHPNRFREVERLLQKKSIAYEKKSQMNGRHGMRADVIFLDTLGDLSATYAFADIAFVGGSLVDVGGHNVIEPARWGKPVLFGPYMANFAEIAGELKAKGCGIEVKGREDLIQVISMLLTDREKALKIGDLACGVVREDRGVVENSLALVDRYMS
jgi:3-deoxy-D-manno-octulosonic-acid transferase